MQHEQETVKMFWSYSGELSQFCCENLFLVLMFLAPKKATRHWSRGLGSGGMERAPIILDAHSGPPASGDDSNPCMSHLFRDGVGASWCRVTRQRPSGRGGPEAWRNHSVSVLLQTPSMSADREVLLTLSPLMPLFSMKKCQRKIVVNVSLLNWPFSF